MRAGRPLGARGARLRADSGGLAWRPPSAATVYPDPSDAAHSDAEWQMFLQSQWFGQLVVAAPGADPWCIPAPYVYEPSGLLTLHLDRRNPALPALAQAGRALFTVLDDVAFVPSAWNRRPSAELRHTAPTVYFAAVQVVGRATEVDDPARLGAHIEKLLARVQPGESLDPVEPGPSPFGRMLGGIRGVEIEVEEVRCRFKMGGDKSTAHRLRIADELAARGTDADLAARAHLLRRVETEPSGSAPSGTEAG